MIRNSLSIFSSNKKKCRAVFLTLVVIAFFLLGVKILNYLYWQEYDWGRILWHNYYKQTENINYIYFGSCHVYCNLNPEILDGKNGKNNFNLSTGDQRLIESYYLLKEANRKNKIEKIYLELYYEISTGEAGVYKNKSTIINSWKNTDYMKYSFNKINALFHMISLKYYPETVFPFVRYREHLMDGNWISERIDYKRSENYKKYICNDGVTEWVKGYNPTTIELANLSFVKNIKSTEMFLTEDAKMYLQKIITYCQDKGIEITLFTSPMYELQPISTENYDSYADNVKEIAAEYGVPYYDFNMVKEEYLPIQNPTYFRDVGRLNEKGAELFTNFFHQVVEASPEKNAKYFYDSYQEKLENSKARVLGLYYYTAEESESLESDEPEKTIYSMIIAAYRETELEYQIFLTPENEETMLLQDFSTNQKFNVSAEEHGVCKIVWRSKKDGEVMGSMKVLY